MLYSYRSTLFLLDYLMEIFKMRKLLLLSCMALMTAPAMAEILKCETLQARIDAKFQAKGIPSYTLEIVPNDEVGNNTDAASSISSTKSIKGKEVGTCDGGTKRIIYTRGN